MSVLFVSSFILVVVVFQENEEKNSRKNHFKNQIVSKRKLCKKLLQRGVIPIP